MNNHRIKLIEKRLDAIEAALGIQKPKQKVANASEDNFAVVTGPHVKVTPELLTRCSPSAGVSRPDIVQILGVLREGFGVAGAADAIQDLIARAAVDLDALEKLVSGDESQQKPEIGQSLWDEILATAILHGASEPGELASAIVAILEERGLV